MPKSHFGPGHSFLPHGDVLSAEEIVRLAGIFTSLGVTKVRFTGGEPLLRRDLDEIVAGIARLGVVDVALTTNGALLRRWAQRLHDAGLRRVTVSLDTVDPDVFARMSDSHVALASVLDGIAAAQDAGLRPIKLNCVVRRGMNDGGVLELAEFARREGLTLRFIEYMDVGNSNGWRREDVVEGAEIIASVARRHHLEELDPEPGAVARRFGYTDGGELGVIMSVSRPFCGDCTRARLSVDGRLFTCLFSADGVDLASPLRAGADDATLRDVVRARWHGRDDRYSEIRGVVDGVRRRVEMSYIGG